MFKDESTIQLELVEKLAVALGAISRLHPTIYNEALTAQLSQMLAESNDRLLKRAIVFLNKRVDCWKRVDKAITVRIEPCIINMNSQDLIRFKVAELASNVPEIDAIFRRLVKDENFKGLSDLLKSVSHEALKEDAIKSFITSGSFDSAYSNGINILLPHARFFDDSDLELVLDGVFSHQKGYHNQILNAGRIDRVFSELYKTTKGNARKHSEIWKKFIEKIQNTYHEYDVLNELMIKDGLIEPSLQESESTTTETQ